MTLPPWRLVSIQNAVACIDVNPRKRRRLKSRDPRLLARAVPQAIALERLDSQSVNYDPRLDNTKIVSENLVKSSESNRRPNPSTNGPQDVDEVKAVLEKTQPGDLSTLTIADANMEAEEASSVTTDSPKATAVSNCQSREGEVGSNARQLLALTPTEVPSVSAPSTSEDLTFSELATILAEDAFRQSERLHSSLYVTNLPNDVVEFDLLALHPKIFKAILSPKRTWAILVFDSIDTTEAALPELNGKILGGYALNVARRKATLVNDPIRPCTLVVSGASACLQDRHLVADLKTLFPRAVQFVSVLVQERVSIHVRFENARHAMHAFLGQRRVCLSGSSYEVRYARVENSGAGDLDDAQAMEQQLIATPGSKELLVFDGRLMANEMPSEMLTTAHGTELDRFEAMVDDRKMHWVLQPLGEHVTSNELFDEKDVVMVCGVKMRWLLVSVDQLALSGENMKRSELQPPSVFKLSKPFVCSSFDGRQRRRQQQQQQQQLQSPPTKRYRQESSPIRRRGRRRPRRDDSRSCSRSSRSRDRQEQSRPSSPAPQTSPKPQDRQPEEAPVQPPIQRIVEHEVVIEVDHYRLPPEVTAPIELVASPPPPKKSAWSRPSEEVELRVLAVANKCRTTINRQSTIDPPRILPSSPPSDEHRQADDTRSSCPSDDMDVEIQSDDEIEEQNENIVPKSPMGNGNRDELLEEMPPVLLEDTPFPQDECLPQRQVESKESELQLGTTVGKPADSGRLVIDEDTGGEENPEPSTSVTRPPEPFMSVAQLPERSLSAGCKSDKLTDFELTTIREEEKRRREERAHRSLYVRNFPPHYTEFDLKQLHPDIKSAYVDSSRTFSFLIFDSADAANAAAPRLRHKLLDGTNLRLTLHNTRWQLSKFPPRPCTLIVEGVGEWLTRRDLIVHFPSAVDIRFRGRFYQNCTKTAFIRFADSKTTLWAFLGSKNMEIGGLRVDVFYANLKPNEPVDDAEMMKLVDASPYTEHQRSRSVTQTKWGRGS